MSDTLLALTGIDLGPYSIRGLSMLATLVDNPSGLRRTINGRLRNFTAPQFRKYAVTISCEDQDAPELTGIWKGQAVGVTFIPGVLGGTDNPTSIVSINALVDNWSSERDEWAALVNWSISLLEE